MHPFEGTARPVLFESNDIDFPYWGKGSSVLLADSSHYYWLTASHVVGNMGGSAEALRILPSDESTISLPFNEQYTIKKEGLEDEEFKDLLALRIDLKEFQAFGDAPLIAQDAERGLLAAESLAIGNELWIVGYPAESNWIDFESRTIKSNRAVIRAIYRGYSFSEHCHTASFETSVSLADYDGLSGSPVFFMRHTNVKGQEAVLPSVVGILLRGTASSGLVHFVSARVVSNLIRLAGDGA